MAWRIRTWLQAAGFALREVVGCRHLRDGVDILAAGESTAGGAGGSAGTGMTRGFLQLGIGLEEVRSGVVQAHLLVGAELVFHGLDELAVGVPDYAGDVNDIPARVDCSGFAQGL